MRRKFFGWAAVFTAIALVASILSVVAPAQRAEAANANDFNPGYIISDKAFFNSGAMNASSIQSFLKSKGGTCASGSTCLSNYKQATNSIAATANCKAYSGSKSESAASIIAKVSVACGINPQVLLVMLQKEQGLVTATSPSDLKYKIAMGYACPDTAACDSKYFGFHNQVYNAASQFKQYTRLPNRQYKIGNVAIQYHPNAACGSSVVNIQNQATANLYNYTPYQPNAAAMANLGGTGDSCSAYGNRNFWRYFSDWFGSPTGNINPVATLDSVNANTEKIRLTGWAFDPDTKNPIEVHVYVDNVGTAFKADGNRPDVAAVYGDIGNKHGFDVSVPVTSSGNKNVCIHAINTGPGSNVLIKCTTVNVPVKTQTGKSGSPVGFLDNVKGGVGSVTVEGWALDPDTFGAIDVHIYIDGYAQAHVANSPRKDIAAAYPGYGANHGYSLNLNVEKTGKREVCAYGINVGKGTNVHLGCKTVTVTSGNPFGAFDTATAGSGKINVSGWAVDPNSQTPIGVHVYVDNTGTALVANTVRNDVAKIHPWYGNDVGFSADVAAGPGKHNVCAYAINVGAGKTNTHLGCKTVTVK